MHSCDNKLCVNPNHLSPGTYRDNNMDRSLKNRNRSKASYRVQAGELAHNAGLTNAQAFDIRKEYIPYKITRKKLAKKYGTTEFVVKRVLSGDTYES